MSLKSGLRKNSRRINPPPPPATRRPPPPHPPPVAPSSRMNLVMDAYHTFEKKEGMEESRCFSAGAVFLTNIKGKVTDAKTGEPLPGVSVLVKGTTAGSVTNSDGEYSLEFDGSEAILLFSFVGYVSQEIQADGQTEINVQLAADQKQLDEVVVVGYGVQTKTGLTSAVSTAKTDEFKEFPYTNIMSALAGRVAGVVVNSAGGEPGSVSAITIRGGEPLIGKTEPLYVIDGIIRDKGTFAALNVNDIENISFLKDAASTAVFGAQATGGIVLVTTKGGGTGKPQI